VTFCCAAPEGAGTIAESSTTPTSNPAGFLLAAETLVPPIGHPPRIESTEGAGRRAARHSKRVAILLPQDCSNVIGVEL
jgi:hypothetical protein